MKYYRNQEIVVKFGKRVRYLRKQQKLTQKQMAYEIGISDVQIRRIEQGEINTSLSVIVSIARTLNVEIEELFKGVSV